MHEGRTILCVLGLAVLAACGEPGRQGPEPVRSRFQAGQVWRYTARPGEGNSRARVVRVENHPKLGVMVHVYVDGLKIPNPSAPEDPERVIRVISHMPLSEKAMDASVETLLLENQPIPPYEAGYDTWKRAFLAGEASVFGRGIAQNVQFYADSVEASTKRASARGK